MVLHSTFNLLFHYKTINFYFLPVYMSHLIFSLLFLFLLLQFGNSCPVSSPPYPCTSDVFTGWFWLCFFLPVLQTLSQHPGQSSRNLDSKTWVHHCLTHIPRWVIFSFENQGSDNLGSCMNKLPLPLLNSHNSKKI